jgi:hypothetical protein
VQAVSLALSIRVLGLCPYLVKIALLSNNQRRTFLLALLLLLGELLLEQLQVTAREELRRVEGQSCHHLALPLEQFEEVDVHQTHLLAVFQHLRILFHIVRHVLQVLQQLGLDVLAAHIVGGVLADHFELCLDHALLELVEHLQTSIHARVEKILAFLQVVCNFVQALAVKFVFVDSQFNGVLFEVEI